MNERNSYQIPEEWELKKFEEITNILTDYVANGSFASLRENVKYNYDKDYAILIRLQDFRNNFIGPFVYVNKKSYDFLKKSALFPNDIIISNVGAHAGMVFRAPNFRCPMTLGPNAVLFRSNIDDNFIYYWLTSDAGQESFNNIITTTAQPKFNKTDLKKIECLIPPLNEQQKIASILSTVDDLVETTNSLINSYTLLKKGLMQTLLTRGIAHKKFKDSVFGEIPEEWKITTLGEIANLITKGTTPLTYGFNYVKNGINFIRVDNISANGEILQNSLLKISQECNTKLSRSIIKKNDILVSIAGTLGRSAIVKEDLLPANTNQALAIIRINNKDCDINYINNTFSSIYFKKYINEISTVGAQPNLSLKQVSNFTILLPPISEQKKIASIFSNISDYLNIYIEKKEYLSLLKKGLMQQLLTGKIRVRV